MRPAVLVAVGALALAVIAPAEAAPGAVLNCGLGGNPAAHSHLAQTGESWGCSVLGIDRASKQDVPVTVSFSIWSAGKDIGALKTSEYKPYFWTTEFTWPLSSAEHSYLIVANVSGRGFTRTLSFPITVNGATRVAELGKAEASGLDASATASGSASRPYEFTLAGDTSPARPVDLHWTLQCVGAGQSRITRGQTASPASEPGIAVAIVKPNLAEAQSCTVTLSGRLQGSGKLSLDLLARLYR